jgi:wobble nucleotide-excising tRNase
MIVTKVVLGAAQGSVDNNKFDIADNVIQVVKDYERSVREVVASKNQKIKELEQETEKKLLMLKAELVKNLGVKLENNL